MVLQYLSKLDTLALIRVAGCLRQGHAVHVMRWISRSADGQSYPAVIGLLAAQHMQQWNILAACFFSFVLELGVYKLIKQSVKRPRPFQKLPGLVNLVAPQDAFSFPSGHTAAAFMICSIIGCCYPSIVLPAYIWASLVGISRIYLGVHYPTDVLAGAILGILSANAGIFVADSLIPLSIHLRS
jgi:undecaprenyl-diphosphatase